MYRSLQGPFIIRTTDALRRRVHERFPERGLAKVCDELLDAVKLGSDQAAAISRPIWSIRFAVAVCVVIILSVLGTLVASFAASRGDSAAAMSFGEFVQTMEAGINELALVGAGIFFLVTLESRIKRQRVLAALHELRSLAHVIDMHQLTKDPERLVFSGEDTDSSPERSLSHFELARYLDYCSEMLSVIGKVAALYAQHSADSVTLGAVDSIEDLTTALSQKIWHKLTVLNQAGAGANNG